MAPTAKLLADGLLLRGSKDGFVLGIRGPWGSGKSSLLALTKAELLASSDPPIVITFAPWQIGDKNILLEQFFAELRNQINLYLPQEERTETAELLRQYARIANGAQVAAQFIEALGFSPPKIVSAVLGWSAERARKASDQSLELIHAQLAKKLAKATKRVVVFVDDLDRIETKEAIEVLRLVRSVADFPNIVYLLAYDEEILAEGIVSELRVPSGTRYLEKFVQAAVDVPKTLNFDLRNWLRSELERHYAKSLDEKSIERLDGVLHFWTNEYVEHPRDVVRILNLLRLGYEPIREQVDLADFVFLQIIRVKKPKLARWLEEYLLAYSAIGDWGYLLDGAEDKLRNELLDTLDEDAASRQRVLFALREILPGIDGFGVLDDPPKFSLFRGLSQAQDQQLVGDKRMASPKHYRYYFASAAPSGTVSASELTGFVRLCESSEPEARRKLYEIVRQPRPQGGFMGEVLLNDLVLGRTDLTSEMAEAVLKVVSHEMDEIAKRSRPNMGYADLLRGEDYTIFGVIERVSKDRQNTLLMDLFVTSQSLSWLAGVARSLYFQSNSTEKSIEKRQTAAARLDAVREIFLDRFSSSTLSNFRDTPYLLSLFYAASEVGSSALVVERIEALSDTDQAFIVLLENCLSWSNSSSDGIEFTLRKPTLEKFFGGVERTIHRLRRIAGSVDEPDMDTRASRLLGKIERGMAFD